MWDGVALRVAILLKSEGHWLAVGMLDYSAGRVGDTLVSSLNTALCLNATAKYQRQKLRFTVTEGKEGSETWATSGIYSLSKVGTGC